MTEKLTCSFCGKTQDEVKKLIAGHSLKDADGKETGVIVNPFNQPKSAAGTNAVGTLLCDDGTAPDANGCCTGETYTEMGPDSEYPFACCPAGSGDCFPPFEVN